MNLRIKRILLIIIVILLISFGTLAVREICIRHEKGLDKSNPMSKEEVIKLLDNPTNNYWIRQVSEETEGVQIPRETLAKDGKMKVYLYSDLIQWVDVNTKEMLQINNESKTAFLSHDGATIKQTTYFNDSSIKYKYLGEKEENNKKFIVVELKGKSVDRRLTINKDTGIIEGIKEFEKKGLITTAIKKDNIEVQYDSVTDEDVAKPDLTGYTINEIE